MAYVMGNRRDAMFPLSFNTLLSEQGFAPALSSGSVGMQAQQHNSLTSSDPSTVVS